MKRLMLILVLAAIAMADAYLASAQYNDIYRRGAKLYSADGTMLTSGQVSAMFRNTEGLTYRDWVRDSRGFKAGKGLLIASGSLTGAGLLTLGVGAAGLLAEGLAVGVGAVFFAPLASLSGETPDFSIDSCFKGVAVAGLVMTGTGILGLATGATVYCVYRKRLDSMVEACNARPDVSLSVGLQRHGAGLALNF